MTTTIGTFAVKDENEIRDDFLRVVKNGLQLHCGVANPNVLPGSDEYVRATAIGYEIAPIYANCLVLGDQLMPDTAQGTYLARIGSNVGLSPRAAAGSTGFGVYATSIAGLVPTGAQLTDPAGLRYQVTVGGTYANGAFIPIAAIDAGSATNLAADTPLSWQSAPPGSSPTMLVANGGLTNGTDVEGDESFRSRIRTLMSNPAGAGTSTYLITLASVSHPSVQSACAYPAFQGPATVQVACFGFSEWDTSAASVSRELDATVVTNIIAGFVQGNIPEHVYSVITGVVDSSTDVSFALSLPSSPSASPPGPGGGWVDGAPWPRNSTSSSTFKCTVTNVTSSTSFRVDAPTAPIAGASHIAWLSTLTWKVYSATVLTTSGSSGAYDITIDTPMTGIAVGDYIWPQSVNQAAYVAAVMNQFGLMGPGEVTSDVTIIPRAFRHPLPALAFPYSLDATMLRAIQNAGDEVLTASYLYRSQTTPALPSSSGDPPKILVPRKVGLYAAV